MESFGFEIRFAKRDLMRFISHLDLLRIFNRAARRAGLPLKFSEGFNPHAKIKIEPAVKLGIEFDGLRATLILKEKMGSGKLRTKIEKQLPKGIIIESISCRP